ncbi:MAG: LacI family DNA-binding transcriptional regulator [Spirochaetia bacterium]
MFHGPESHYFTKAITTGYRRALSEHGIPFDESLYVDGEYHITNGYEPAKRLIESGVRFDGIVSNDEMTSGAMKALKEKGLKIPDDVSLFGFDNLIISNHTDPLLSTVDVSYEYMGRIAVRKSIENISIRESLPVQIILPVSLIPRKTVRPLEKYQHI